MKEIKMKDRIEYGGLKAIKNANIGSAIRYIDAYAFCNCEHLKKLVIGENVEEIDKRAFGSGCGSLEEIAVHPHNTYFYVEDNCLIETSTGELKLCIDTPRIADSVRCIEFNCAFEQFGTFEELYIGRSLEKLEIGEICRSCGFNRIVLHPDNQHFEVIDNCLFYRNGTELLIGGIDCVIPEKTTKIGNHAFYRSENGARYHMTIPQNVTSIGEFAFTYAGIQSIRIPGRVVSIGRRAFEGCQNLRTVEFEHGLKQIENRAFRTSGIEALHLPDSVKTVDENAFESCGQLKTVTGLGSIEEISDNLFFHCKTLETVVLPPTLKTIKRCAFDQCAQLKNIDIPAGVTKIEEGTFSGCICLEKVIMGDSVKDIGRFDIFSGCKVLKELRLSNSLHSIPLRAFWGCQSLREITLPPSVKKLESYCFENCTELVSINTGNLTKIARDAFSGCNKLPAEMKTLPKPQKAVATKSLLPDELWSRGYTADELASEVNNDEEIYFITMSYDNISVTFHNSFDYDNEVYLLVSHQDQLFFIETDDEMDEEEEVHQNCYRAIVYGESHPLFSQLKAVYEQRSEKEEYELVFKTPSTRKSVFPAEVWSEITAEELIDNGEKEIEDFMTMIYGDFDVTFLDSFNYDNNLYLLVSKQGLQFFIYINSDIEEEKFYGEMHRVTIYEKDHPLFPQLKEAYEQARE